MANILVSKSPPVVKERVDIQVKQELQLTNYNL